MKKVTCRSLKILLACAIVIFSMKAASLSVFAYEDDYSAVTINTSAKSFFATKSYDSWEEKWYYNQYDTATFDVVVGGLNGKTLDSTNLDIDINRDAYAGYTIMGNNTTNGTCVVRIYVGRVPMSNAKITLTFGDDWYDDIIAKRYITVNCYGVNLSGGGNGYVIKGKTKQLKVSGYGGNVTWKSSKPKVVSVTSKGKIKALKEGSALITATLPDGTKLGYVANAVSNSRYKIIKKANYIGSHWKYSQSRRMSNGYYDCSSLVWKDYKAGGRKLVNGGYAPTAADIAKWCVKHKKIPKGKATTNFDKMVYKPGALIFGTGAKNGRYKGIYHVEMFTGYQFGGFYNGKAIINTLWGNRGVNYGYGYSNLVAQPF
ncbi:MAG: Ig-like domain-containing protein [Eubacteriales bacterium]|nr:Ig-like domain-containing protein [Eubacteriales bacterium]